MQNIFWYFCTHFSQVQKQRLIPVFFIFTSVKRRLISAFVFCQSPKNCRKYRICSTMTFFFFFEIACQITEKIGLQHGTMIFFSFWRSVFCSITKPKLRHFRKSFRTLSHFFRHLRSRGKLRGNTIQKFDFCK